MCLPPLIWQTYDVEFNARKTDEAGKEIPGPGFTVRHNGVVVHGGYGLSGSPGAQRGLKFQQHGNRVQYRNIWVVEE